MEQDKQIAHKEIITTKSMCSESKVSTTNQIQSKDNMKMTITSILLTLTTWKDKKNQAGWAHLHLQGRIVPSETTGLLSSTQHPSRCHHMMVIRRIWKEVPIVRGIRKLVAMNRSEINLEITRCQEARSNSKVSTTPLEPMWVSSQKEVQFQSTSPTAHLIN